MNTGKHILKHYNLASNEDWNSTVQLTYSSMGFLVVKKSGGVALAHVEQQFRSLLVCMSVMYLWCT